VGEKCTYRISRDKKVKTFGEDAADYENFWGATPKY
jgi:hypothetical protein